MLPSYFGDSVYALQLSYGVDLVDWGDINIQGVIALLGLVPRWGEISCIEFGVSNTNNLGIRDISNSD